SISTALAMTYAGARGETEKQMAATLRFSLGQEELHPAFADLSARLARTQKEGQVQWTAANSLWPQQQYPFLPEYVALLEKEYGVSVTPLDFGEPESVRARINGWVEEKTREKIRNLIQPGFITSMTRLVLVNAIYFKGKWAAPFDAAATRDAPFHLSADQTVQAPMMIRKLKCAYAHFPELDLAELPYAGGDCAMLILLPATVDGLRTLEQGLTADRLGAWRDEMSDRDVLVTLPRFTMTSAFRLNDTLSAMGMPDAFSDTLANFAGMDGRPDWLYIGAVLHKAFVEVNEEGTEAAAATAVVMQPRAMAPSRPVLFTADHPFLFLIVEKQTGSLLFMGRLSDPTKAGE
ncbi:MAG TPA: serpin family protein, partial [Kiritimatiellia bacterium]|nr:serpin family protein [Kiritimatiellia bacterium]